MRRQDTTLIYLLHMLFWLSYVLINFYVSSFFFNLEDTISRFVFMTVLNIPVYYICTAVLVPVFYEKRQYWTYFIACLGVFICSIFLRLWLEPLVTLHHSSFSQRYLIGSRLFLIRVYISQGTIIFVASLLGIVKHKFNIENKLTELKLVKAETDLNLVKAKMNPHFLLNTLNNIYAQSYAEQSKSSQAILQLSQLLQYTVYETGKRKIPVEKELQMIHALIGLYQLKYQNVLPIRLEYDAAVLQDDSFEIPPMVFFSLVENALKHSSIGLVEGAYISILFSVEKDRIFFVVENNIAPPILSTDHYRGFGKAGLRQLLDMEYPDSYSLAEVSEKGKYITTLMIRI